VIGSSFLNFIGTDQVRHYGFPADGELTLSLFEFYPPDTQ